jgi:microcystin-dependent protein/cytoskeletal protein CcmA (bactofilin family)
MKIKRRAINRDVFYDNRLTNFTKPPITNGDLYVKRNQSIRGNLIVNKNQNLGGDLDISGNVTIHKNLTAKNYYATENYYADGSSFITQNQSIGGDLDISGNVIVNNDVTARGDLHVGLDLDISGNVIVNNDVTARGDLHVGLDLDISGNVIVNNDVTASNYYATGNYYLNGHILIPAGTVIQSASTSAPAGWLDCYGQSLATASYFSLFTAIGYTYGGSGANFNLPDLRGRVAIGQGVATGVTTARTVGDTGGEETHTLVEDEMPSHTHSLDRRANPDEVAFDPGNAHASESSACTTDRNIIAQFNTFSAGSNVAHNNMQPYLALRYLIKY